MSTARKIWMTALAVSLGAAPFVCAADDAQDAGTEMAIEKKFSKPADDAGTNDAGQQRSRMGAPQDAARQGLLAQLLVLQTGLYRYLPANPTDQQCFQILAENKIEPKEGWNADKIVTRGDLGRVIVQGLGMQDQVENPDDPRAWLDVLASVGINITTIGEAVEKVNPITNPAAGPSFRDKLDGDATLDNEDLAYVLSDVFPPVEKRPVTPN